MRSATHEHVIQVCVPCQCLCLAYGAIDSAMLLHLSTFFFLPRILIRIYIEIFLDRKFLLPLKAT